MSLLLNVKEYIVLSIVLSYPLKKSVPTRLQLRMLVTHYRATQISASYESVGSGSNPSLGNQHGAHSAIHLPFHVSQ